MKRIPGLGSLLMLSLSLPLLAAESPAPATAPAASAAADAAAMQPAVNTSPTSTRNSTSNPTSSPASNPIAVPTAAPVAPAGPAANRPATPAARAPGAAATAATPRGKAQDRLELDTTQITGNRELPRVLYVVPWKRSDLGDLAGRPANSLLDEVLAPVDRDVFKRQNRYYDALKPDTTAGRSEGEK